MRGNTLRRAAERGQSRQGWLESFHSFSVGDYYDPDLAAYGPLLSLNERIAQPGGGYSTYGQRHMEVVTYVLEGEFGHEDSMGNSETLLPGEVQLVSAGTGIRRSELNRSDSQPVRYLQIWISPEAKDTRSTYQRARFAAEERRGRLRLIASADGRNASLRIRQQVSLYAGLFDGGERAELALAPGRHAYVHIARGTIEADGECLLAGDGLMSEAQRIVLERGAGAEVLVFDLP